MAIIVVARLRLRDPSLLDEFFTHAVAVIEQAQKTDGNRPHGRGSRLRDDYGADDIY